MACMAAAFWDLEETPRARGDHRLSDKQGQNAKPLIDLEYGKHAFHKKHGRYATLQEKLAAIRMYADESRRLTWLTSNVEIRLIEGANGRLNCLMHDVISQKIWGCPFDCHGVSIERTIQELKEHAVTLNGDFPVFSRFIDIVE